MGHMKTVVIGDIHGRPVWKLIVKAENPDKVIFMGDYFDSYDDYTAVEQMHNFKEIVEYKESGQAVVVMLIGNHDYHYMPGVTEHYSGYQAGARASIEHLLYENKHHLKMTCQLSGEFLFSHAGISPDWLLIHGYSVEHNVVDWVNDMWQYKPNVFNFAGHDPYGDSVVSPPIWIRPKSLQKANRESFIKDNFIQVVGHTQQNKIDTEGKSTGGRYYYIDTLGTSGEYMVIEGNNLTFNTWKNY